MNKKPIRLEVNGQAHDVEVDARKLLVEMLRDDLSLTGTHLGCGTGTCGACTVMLDGRIVESCCVLAADADGTSISTIEGVADRDGLHPVQQALVEQHGIQCGFCTPGMVLSTIELLNYNPAPTDAEVREALAGNLCRCTTRRAAHGRGRRLVPLYDFRCTNCGATQEELRSFSGRDQDTCCRQCGATATRVQIAKFGIAGTKPRTSDASLASTGSDFLSNPDKFVTAMDTFGEKVGAPLTSNEKERAVTRLEEAK